MISIDSNLGVRHHKLSKIQYCKEKEYCWLYRASGWHKVLWKFTTEEVSIFCIRANFLTGGFADMGKDMNNEQILLNIEETAHYLNIGKTKTRELMKQYDKQWVVRIGNRSYAHKDLLNKWLLAQVKI